METDTIGSEIAPDRSIPILLAQNTSFSPSHL
ncbi:MAG: hypothetical protein ACJAQ3_002344 [Planctomycetota bacterium]|jgi:hypothetical protein